MHSGPAARLAPALWGEALAEAGVRPDARPKWDGPVERVSKQQLDWVGPNYLESESAGDQADVAQW